MLLIKAILNMTAPPFQEVISYIIQRSLFQRGNAKKPAFLALFG
jgi:hypothetical protein